MSKQTDVADAYLEYRDTVRDSYKSHDDVYWAKEKLETAANIYEAYKNGGPSVSRRKGKG